MAGADDRRRTALILGALAFGLSVVRIWIAANVGLAPDEAYYWTWSRDLSLVYRDHPPLVAFAMAIGSRLLDSEVGVRLPSILCGAAALPATYLLATAVGLTTRPAILAGVIGAILPAPAAGALIATPDSFVGLAWLLGGLALVRLAGSGDPRHWITLGAAVGVGLLAKHSAALMLAAAGVVLLVVPGTRAALRTRFPWLGLGLCALVASPYLIAEIAAGAPSISLQLDHLRGALGPGGPSGAGAIAGRLVELAGGQFGLLTPIVALLFAMSFGRPARSNVALRAVQVAALTPIVATALVALATHPEQNWASLGHPFAAVAAVAAAEMRFAGRSRTTWQAVVLGTALAASITVHVHAVSPFIPLPPERDPVSRLHGYADLRAVERYVEGAAAIVCDNYGLASELSWERRHEHNGPKIASLDRPRRLPPGRWILIDESGDVGRLTIEPAPCAPKTRIAGIPLRRADGAVVRTLDVYRCDASGTAPARRETPCPPSAISANLPPA